MGSKGSRLKGWSRNGKVRKEKGTAGGKGKVTGEGSKGKEDEVVMG